MSNSKPTTGNWLYSPAFDSLFILFPPFAALIAVILMPARYRQTADMPVMGWVIFILLIDVAHVYSTLYNTYFDRQRFSRYKSLYLGIPVFCYCAGVCLHLLGGMVFWRMLAYLAVFHFIRQQYGFVRLYSRKEQQAYWAGMVDTIAIYSATLYPLLYWHFTPGRNFNWFVAGDFGQFTSSVIKELALVAYLIIIAAYLVKEAIIAAKTRHINIPKNLVIIGTTVSWYCGIVLFNGDMAFTALNVVAHGIPYMALVWAMTRKPASTGSPQAVQKSLFNKYNILVFLGSLFLFSYIEEGLWDGMVWREHTGIFHWFTTLPIIENHWALSFLVPLLSLPQSTHYVLDGFIWRRKYA